MIAFQRGELNANKDGITGTNWMEPVHDRLGNMTTIPEPANLAGGLTATYDAWKRLVLVFDGHGDLTNRYLHGPAVDQILADEQVDSLAAPGEVLWPLTDNLGTVRDLTVYDDATGITAIVNHLTYNAFGEITDQTDPTVTHRFAFTGREWDEDAGLYYYRARWYDPELGRFLSEDPIGFRAGDANLQRYVENVPTVYVDPAGLDIGHGSFRVTEQMKQAVQDIRNAQFIANLESLRAYLNRYARTDGAREQVDVIIEGLREARKKIDAGGGPVLLRCRLWIPFVGVWEGPGALCTDCEQAVQENWRFVDDATFFYMPKFKTRGLQHQWGEITLGFEGETLVTIDFWKNDIAFWRPGKSGFGYIADDDVPVPTGPAEPRVRLGGPPSNPRH